MFRSFLAGLHDVHVLTEFAGAQRGLQVNFTLLGAHRFLDAAMSDVANRCLDLGDIIGAQAAGLLSERLQDAKDWPARFDLMDRFLLERLARGRPMSPDVAWAFRQLQAGRGARSIGALSRALACSRKTLIKRFHAQIGLTPKAVAGILRFEHAAGRLGRTMRKVGANSRFPAATAIRRISIATSGDTPAARPRNTVAR